MIGQKKTWAIIMVGIMVLTWVLGDVSLSWADKGSSQAGRTEIRARGVGAAIGGIIPELNGKFRNETAKGRMKLQGELENINLALGTHVTFCLLVGGAGSPVFLATEPIIVEATENIAEFGLDSRDAPLPVSTVVANDVLQAWQGDACSGTQLATATFQ